MKRRLKSVRDFFSKNYWLLLTLVVIISYSQLLFMYPWQDDHALFFKLANIREPAGYLGRGLFGQGAYKYTAAYYYPIFLFFGHWPPAYFFLSLSFFVLTTLVVYKVFSKILGERTGRLAGFLYACGYVAADGFIRLYNSVGTSLSVILISLLLFSYWKFFKKGKIKWYGLALVFYFLAVEFIRYRTHYLISVVVLFELLFLAFKKPWRSIATSFFRLLPFGWIFYNYFMAEDRTSQVSEMITSVIKGEYYKLFSFFTSVTNLIIPDWLSSRFFPKDNFLFSFRIFKHPALISNTHMNFIASLGLLIFLLGVYLFFRQRKSGRKIYLFLGGWFVLNIASYAAYQPTVAYETTNRFFAHSLFALVGLFAFLARKNKRAYYLILCWGVGNLLASVVLLRNIVVSRSIPQKSFYQQLQAYVPEVQKGDVFYFDVADNARANFNDAFSVAQMPEETAIAWLYDIDRYDIRLFTDLDEFLALINSSSPTVTDKEDSLIPVNQFHTFFYSQKKLKDTTCDFKESLSGSVLRRRIDFTVSEGNGKTMITFKELLKSHLPVNLVFRVRAAPFDARQLSFPIGKVTQMSNNKVALSEDLRQQAFDYERQKLDLNRGIVVDVSSQWEKDVAQNLVDNNLSTIWRPDRITWKEDGAVLTLDLGKAEYLGGFVWVNAYPNNTPTFYKIEVSLDGKVWKQVAQVDKTKKIKVMEPNVIGFNKELSRYVRMTISETLNNDAAGISEVWVLPSGFADLDIKAAEEFLNAPFEYVPSADSYQKTLQALDYWGKVPVSWVNNKNDKPVSEEGNVLNLRYDGVIRDYKFKLSGGGTEVSQIVFAEVEIPGLIEVLDLEILP